MATKKAASKPMPKKTTSKMPMAAKGGSMKKGKGKGC